MRYSFVSSAFFLRVCLIDEKSKQQETIPYPHPSGSLRYSYLYPSNSHDMLYQSEEASLHFGRFQHAQVTIQGVWSFCMCGRAEGEHRICKYVRQGLTPHPIIYYPDYIQALYRPIYNRSVPNNDVSFDVQ